MQRYRLEAGNGFQPKLLSREALQHIPGKEGHLRIHADGHDRFLLGLAGNPEKRPPPGWQEVPTAIALAPGQFIRFIVNARHTSQRGQWYVETVQPLVRELAKVRVRVPYESMKRIG